MNAQTRRIPRTDSLITKSRPLNALNCFHIRHRAVPQIMLIHYDVDKNHIRKRCFLYVLSI